MSREPAPPPGFVELTVRSARAVVTASEAETLRGVLERETLYAYAVRHPRGHPLAGRGIAYAVPLSETEPRVVVRHNRHGGLFAPLTGDRFLRPTRAPRELATSLELRDAGVATPDVVAYVVYHAGPLLRRADVATREIVGAADLSTYLMSADGLARRRALAATAALIDRMSRLRARHHDLNIKNVLLVDRGGHCVAMILDVDRVEFSSRTDVALERNVARLLRSARRWRERHGALVSDSELQEFVERANARS